MTFEFLHSAHQEGPIHIPQIGLTLTVLTAIETINEPGFGPPLHRHRETEVFYVLEGRYLFDVDGKPFVAETGDVVSVPGGVAHAFVNITDKPARQFIQILPGLDACAFFLGLGDVMRTGKPDREALNAFGARWQVEFLGPPLKAESIGRLSEPPKPAAVESASEPRGT
jgi:quercetin dioxygenase-like cupin family protein